MESELLTNSSHFLPYWSSAVSDALVTATIMVFGIDYIVGDAVDIARLAIQSDALGVHQVPVVGRKTDPLSQVPFAVVSLALG